MSVTMICLVGCVSVALQVCFEVEMFDCEVFHADDVVIVSQLSCTTQNCLSEHKKFCGLNDTNASHV